MKTKKKLKVGVNMISTAKCKWKKRAVYRTLWFIQGTQQTDQYIATSMANLLDVNNWLRIIKHWDADVCYCELWHQYKINIEQKNPRFWPHHINAVISVSLPKAAETVEENRKELLSASLLNQILYNEDTRGWRLLNQLVNWQNMDEGF